MQEKNPQEKAAAEKQAELLINAMERAKQNGGVWLNPSEKTAPRFYPRGVNVSAFNAMTMALHSDQNNYKTNEYTLFSEAKKRGESVQSKEKGVPFNWYNWKEYVNRHNPEDVISREDYKALDESKQSEYKGVRTREVRALFNIDQTTLPFVDKERYQQEVKTQGGSEDREHSKSESDHLRISVNDFILNENELKEAIHEYADALKAKEVDTVILGCTHYPFVREYLQEAFGPGVTIVDPAEATALQAKADLEARGLLRTEGQGSCTICFTGDVGLGKQLAERMLDPAACEFKQVKL